MSEFFVHNDEKKDDFNSTIFVFTPIHQREWVLPYFLRNLYDIDYNKKDMVIFFLVNNCTDESLRLVSNFKTKYSCEYKDVVINIWNNPSVGLDERSVEQRFGKTYDWLSALRNRGAYECLQSGCDYLLSLDSDILVTKDIVKNLLSHKKDYIAGLIYNGYSTKEDSPHSFPNVLRRDGETDNYLHIKNYYTKNKKGLIEVDFTGAIFLCSKKALPYLKFAKHKLGEDLPACLSLANNGFKLFCSCDDYCQHIMEKRFLDQFKNFPDYEEGMEFTNGCKQ